jgi:hypothetical protein
MKQKWLSRYFFYPVFIILFVGLFFFRGNQVKAAPNPIIPRGAALYDKWYAVQGTDPLASMPAGDMPLWSKQSTNSLSGPDTWRCTSCHGWDYLGKDGAYSSGSNFTGFPGLLNASMNMSKDVILEQLSGGRDPQHDFSKYLLREDLEALAAFVKEGIIIDQDFIDPVTLKPINPNLDNGKQLYNTSCSECHGEDGNTLKIRFVGQDAGLGLIAIQDPWRFLHKTRFGTPGTDMVIGYELGWTPQDGRDVLAFMQSAHDAQTEISQPSNLSENRSAPVQQKGGPAQNIFGGLLTIFGAMGIGLGINILAAASLVGVLLIVVWILRGR